MVTDTSSNLCGQMGVGAYIVGARGYKGHTKGLSAETDIFGEERPILLNM